MRINRLSSLEKFLSHATSSIQYRQYKLSIYELWINKSNDLPYKKRREMSHDISVSTCSNLEINKLTINDFNASDYFPKDYEIVKYSDLYKKKSRTNSIQSYRKKSSRLDIRKYRSTAGIISRL